MTINVFHDVQRVQGMYFLEKVKTALQNLENPEVLLKDPVGPNEGPWLFMDPVSLQSLDMIIDIQNAKIWPLYPIILCLIKDSETSPW